IADAYGNDGGTVVIAARGQRAEFAQSVIDASGWEGYVVECDVTQLRELGQRYEDVKAALGGRIVNDFFNSAAVLRDGPMHRMSDEDDDLVFTTNQRAAHQWAKVVIPDMRSAKDGTFTPISSIVGHLGHNLQVNYAQAKAANIALARSLAQEVGPKGIHANAILPGLADTEIIVNMPRKMRDEYLANTISGELMSPGDIAIAAIETILDPEINGRAIFVDDGFTAQTDLATPGDRYWVAGRGFMPLEEVQALVAEAKAARAPSEE